MSSSLYVNWSPFVGLKRISRLLSLESQELEKRFQPNMQCATLRRCVVLKLRLKWKNVSLLQTQWWRWLRPWWQWDRHTKDLYFYSVCQNW